MCIRYVPLPWSFSLVLMLLKRASLCICRAVLGSSSEIRTPGTLVSIDRNGPPVSVLGLGSQVSSWLAPPASQITRTCRCFLASSAAIAGLVKLEKPAPMPVAADARQELPTRKNMIRGVASVGASHGQCSHLRNQVNG